MFGDEDPSASPAAGTHLYLTRPEKVALKVFGKLEITVEGKPVKLSGRAATLLTYLALEDRPLHRTSAAQLLWPHSGEQGLLNLRVELTGLRRQGIELSPNRSSTLSLRASTELDELHGKSGESRTRLVAALAPPLHNFNDHGNPELLVWAKRQRQRLTRVVNDLVNGSQNQQAPAPRDVPVDQHLVQWLAGRILPELRAFIQGARRPQLVMYVGRAGSGRRESLESALTQLGLPQVELPAISSPDSMRALLLVNLTAALKEALPHNVYDLSRDQEGEATELSRLVSLLMQVGPLAIVIRGAERLSDEAAHLIDYLMGLARPLLVVAITTPAGRNHVSKTLGHHDQPGWFHEIHLPPLTPESLPASSDVTELDSDSDVRFETIRQTEGFLAAIRCQLPISAADRGRLGQRLQRTLQAELAMTLGENLGSVQALALLPGPFSEVTALGTLSQAGLGDGQATHVLKRALQTGVLERVDSLLPVRMSEMQVRLPDAAGLLCFRSELHRAALATSLDASDRQKLRRPLCVLPTVAQSVGPEVGVTPLAVGPSTLGPHNTVRLPGGYVLLARSTGWTVLRLGAAAHAVPRLELHFAVPATAQRWQLRLRLQRVTNGEQMSIHILSGVGTSPREVNVRPWSRPLEANGWVLAEGTLTEHYLILSVQCSDLILHLAQPEFM